MAVVLDSYVFELAEAELFTNYTVFKQLCTIDADAVDPSTTLSGTRLDRAHQALNWGKRKVDSLLNVVYDVPFITSAASPDMIVKQWCVRFAVIFLWQFHSDRTEQLPEAIQDLTDEINEYTRPGGLAIPGHPRSTQGEAVGRYLKPSPISGSIYDKAGFFSDEVIRALDGDNLDGT